MIDWKKDGRTPGEIAAERYPEKTEKHELARSIYARALASVVPDRDILIEELVGALVWQLQITAGLNDEGMNIEHQFLSDALSKARSHGYGVNTTEG